MKNLKVFVGAACLLVVAATASAQMGMGMRQLPIPRGVFSPVVGSGAAYEITTSDGRKTNIEYAIVGKESVNGKDAYWMEWTTSGMGSGQMVMKVLTAVGDSTITSRVIMQMPGRPPMEMPAQMTGRTNSQSVPADVRTSAEDVGSESITVPAGTFTCEHYRMKDGSGDTWVSTKVNPLGVVKHQGKDSTMVLTKVITDAKDKIVGTPQPFNPMMMQQPRQE
ncbi:MAG: hypothetical protein ABR953_14540 [Candidatus Acidiferrales bacterium]|jgi:hypothetical protein